MNNAGGRSLTDLLYYPVRYRRKFVDPRGRRRMTSPSVHSFPFMKAAIFALLECISGFPGVFLLFLLRLLVIGNVSRQIDELRHD